MKLVIASLNAKYVHTSLSVRCLYASVKDICECEFCEYTINDSADSVAQQLYIKNFDVISFSCYIWNIENVLKIAYILKNANPKIKIILGGYEAEYDANQILKNNPFIDIICMGEGEITFKKLICALSENRGLDKLRGIVYYNGIGKIITAPAETQCANLDELPFVYDETIDLIKDKIIYYESSRGCPYGCTYCISGETSKVRFLSVARVKKELKFFIDHNVRLVKFVDRTFNANPSRAREIFEFIIKNSRETCFHMELAGDILDAETIELLKCAPKGILQFEIGVQTTNNETMRAIDRKISFERLSENVKALIDLENIHIHLDLIAGLPYENINSFKKSFNDVLGLRPDVLQLGFLKLLKGSKIRSEADKYGYVYRNYPPYEVISNSFIGYDDIIELKNIENVLDKYYNSGSFKKTVDFLFEKYESKYDLFYCIGKYFADNFPAGFSFSKQKLFDIMYECFKFFDNDFVEALKYDFLLCFRAAKRPYWFGKYDDNLLQKTYDMFKNEELKKEKFPSYYDVPAKEIMKHIHTERFSYGVMLFDYRENKVYDVTNILN